MTTLSNPIRLFAALAGFAAIAATLIMTFSGESILERTDGSPAQNLWELLRFFTILTNIITAFCLLEGALKKRWRSFHLLTGCAMWISLVGLIYHTLLAAEHNPANLAAQITNQIHHTFVPIATVLIWVFTNPRKKLPLSSPFKWLIFPLIYMIYILIRGHFENLYPYPFSDPSPELGGWPIFFAWQVGFIVLFLAFGFLFRWINDRLVERIETKTDIAKLSDSLGQ